MPVIDIAVQGKKVIVGGQCVVNANTDYTVRFTFSPEWDGYALKTMRINYPKQTGGTYVDVPFTGSQAALPPISPGAERISVGVYAGDLVSTTPGYIYVLPSILNGGEPHPEPPEDVYIKLAGMIESGAVQGPPGERGEPGPQGPAGAGVPEGGAVGQILGKSQEGAAWIDPPTGGAQPDWNQNDPEGPGYIRNRPFYSTTEPTEILKGTYGFAENQGVYVSAIVPAFDISPGKSYTVVWDGQSYSVEGRCASGYMMGNEFFITGNPDDDTGEPFIILSDGYQMIALTLHTSLTHDITVIPDGEYVQRINKKYLDMDFPVNITGSPEDGWASDKSQMEISKAVLDGKRVYALVGESDLGRTRLPLVQDPYMGSQDFPAVFMGFVNDGVLRLWSFRVTFSYHDDKPVVDFTDESGRLLPPVRGYDEGKTLKVVDGKWVLAEVTA